MSVFIVTCEPNRAIAVFHTGYQWLLRCMARFLCTSRASFSP